MAAFVSAAAQLLSTCQEAEPVSSDRLPADKPETVADPGVDRIEDGRAWRRLEADGLHDRQNDLITYLQQPSEALAALPKGGPDGNQVDWMEALRSGQIEPRTNIWPETKIRVLDLDIVFTDTGGMPHVVFPHRQHTAWLDCKNCHEKLFRSARGKNDISMFQILQGEYCGRCHGAVAFPLTECQRCHSRDWQKRVAN